MRTPHFNSILFLMILTLTMHASTYAKTEKSSQRPVAEDTTFNEPFSLLNDRGIAYALGHELPKNDIEAVKRFRQAAEQGLPVAQRNLGIMYAFGKGVLQSDREAARYFRKAAEQGDVIAQMNLGVMCATGKGISKNESEAVKWFHKAAHQGLPMAQRNLGLMYGMGKGVKGFPAYPAQTGNEIVKRL